jgi:hypothetical protein
MAGCNQAKTGGFEMSIAHKDMEKEVADIIERRIEAGQETVTSWLVTEVINNHADITGEDVEWYRVCAYGHMSGVVRKVISKYRPTEEGIVNNQLVLDGFERLQRAYAVNRDGPMIVPIDLLTIDEIKEKIRELSAIRRGLSQHIKELQRYLQQRIEAENAKQSKVAL